MKDKILMLIIGILIGAIITTGGFLILGKKDNKGNRMERRNFDANMIDGGRREKLRNANSIEAPLEKPEGDDEKIAPSSPAENT